MAIITREMLEESATWTLRAAGLNPDLEEMQDTPRRYIEMLRELTTPKDIKWKTFSAPGDEMIIVEGITFTSLCAHHVLPFLGTADIAYVPAGQIAGLSKFARVVRHFAARLQVQELLTTQIADYLIEHLDPKGLGIVLRAEHLCMTIRGVQAPGTRTTTSAMRGVFLEHDKTAKAEFLQFINGGK